jgi:hypothetical protein
MPRAVPLAVWVFFVLAFAFSAIIRSKMPGKPRDASGIMPAGWLISYSWPVRLIVSPMPSQT